MPSFTLDVDQLSVQKTGFSTNLMYGDNFNLVLNLVKSGIVLSANSADTVTITVYKAGQTISGGAVQNLAIVGNPIVISPGGINALQVNVSLLTSQLATLVQTPSQPAGCLIHIQYTQSDGEVCHFYPDTAITIYPALTLSTTGTAAQAPAGYPNPVNIQVYSPIINGDFSVNQRLNTLTTLGNSTTIYAQDKWKIQTSALTGRFTITSDQQTAIASLPFVSPDWTATTSLKLACTTSQASPAAGDFGTISQFIESALWTPFLSQPFSIAFLYKTNLTATLGFFVQDQALAYSFVIPFALTGDGNWHYASASVLIPPTAATWNINDAANGFSAKIGFTFICGTTFTAANNNVWNTTGGFLAPTGIGNFLNNTANTLQLTQVAISPGTFAQPWGQIAPPMNLALCRRYYRKSFPISVAPGTANATGPLQISTATTTSLAYGSVFYGEPMRTAGTPVSYSPSTGATPKAFDITGAIDVTVTGFGQVNEFGFSTLTASATLTATHVQEAHWTNDVDY